eukprot:COSAG04_NODE_23070_length_344_cov_1.004082_1_plen_31_part_10
MGETQNQRACFLSEPSALHSSIMRVGAPPAN